MGIHKMITKGKCFDLLTNSFNKLLESFWLWDKDDYELTWVPETFLAQFLFLLSLNSGPRENFRCTREKPLVPRVTTSTRFPQYWVLLTREPASFWRENVILQQVLARMS